MRETYIIVAAKVLSLSSQCDIFTNLLSLSKFFVKPKLETSFTGSEILFGNKHFQNCYECIKLSLDFILVAKIESFRIDHL